MITIHRKSKLVSNKDAKHGYNQRGDDCKCIKLPNHKHESEKTKARRNLRITKCGWVRTETLPGVGESHTSALKNSPVLVIVVVHNKW